MTTSFPAYPAGRSGVGILLVRVGAVCSLLEFLKSSTPLALIASVVASALLLGALTRWAALSGLVLCLFLAFTADWSQLWLRVGPVAAMAAIALIGPGSVSLDAHWFGRRTIRLKKL